MKSEKRSEMRKEYSEIYNECFPQFRMNSERFEKAMLTEKAEVIDYCENGQCLGFVIIEDSAVRLICVTPDRQREGIGQKLMSWAEDRLRDKGVTKALTGGASSRLFIGATTESWPFFEKRGYVSVGGCDEMLLKLDDFDINAYKLRGHEQAKYGWYEGDLETLKEAVGLVQPGWLDLYSEQSHVYVGTVDGEIASFCMVDMDCQNYLTEVHGRVGMPGCVGCVPKFRDRGIALEMIAWVTQYLKDNNMDISFIFYTGVAEWYSKLGYETFLTEVFGAKDL